MNTTPGAPTDAREAPDYLSRTEEKIWLDGYDTGYSAVLSLHPAPSAALAAPVASPEPVAREDFDAMSGNLTRAKNLLVRLYDQIGRDASPEKLRGMIEGATGSWFVWGADRDAAIAPSPPTTPITSMPAEFREGIRAGLEDGTLEITGATPPAAEPGAPIEVNLTQLAIAMRNDARAVFRADGPECTQDVRDAIEYCHGLLCAIQARADYAKKHDASTAAPSTAQGLSDAARLIQKKSRSAVRGHQDAAVAFVTYEVAAADLNALAVYVNQLEDAILAATKEKK